MKLIKCAADDCAQMIRKRRVTHRFCSRQCLNRTSGRGRVLARNANWRGGKTKHPLYERYIDMIGRCYRQSHARYADYGGRGITVCQRWREDFWAYAADMGLPPKTGQRMTVERKDNDGPYNLQNCVWATYSEQCKNRRASAYAGITNDPITGQFRSVV